MYTATRFVHSLHLCGKTQRIHIRNCLIYLPEDWNFWGWLCHCLHLCSCVSARQQDDKKNTCITNRVPFQHISHEVIRHILVIPKHWCYNVCTYHVPTWNTVIVYILLLWCFTVLLCFRKLNRRKLISISRVLKRHHFQL